MMRFVLSFTLFFLVVAPVRAQEDFSVRQLIGTDDEPPTTPSPLVIDDVTSDQIDISWTASTDDYIFGGYQVFRDSVQIATTTLTSYSDTGLDATTTYSYNVVAFDQALNFSTSSNAVTTTTEDIFVPPPEAVDEGGRNPNADLVSLAVEPDLYNTLLSWETTRTARYVLRWGRTESYELGIVSTQQYRREQQSLITDLEPNTVYEFELMAYDREGDGTLLARDQFRTLARPDATPPPNIANFTARGQGDDVLLTWNNPQTDFAYVRIVRNPLFYPTDPNNGFIAYQGTDAQFTDADAFQRQDPLYYTAFVYDEAGNRSSGATAFTRRVPVRDPGAAGTDPAATVTDPDTATTETATDTPLAPPLRISLDDVVIIQNEEVIDAVDDSYLVDTSQAFTLSAPFDLFPKHLKAIQATLSHPVDETESYSYLLRINADKTAYEATIDGLGLSGTIPLTLTVYDFETERSAVAEGSIVSKQKEPEVAIVEDVAPWYADYYWAPFPILLLLLLGWWLVAWKRRSA